jgi:hypothetical protein
MLTHSSGRRWLRAAVGALWLIAGGLQLQSFMFTRGFAQDVLGSAALSQPAPIASIIHTAERVVSAHPAPWNWVFALTELLIGAGLLFFRSGRVLRLACWGSVAFGAGIWIVGEGLGGLLNGTAALSTGLPGAALLYSLLTIAAWPSTAGEDRPLPQRTLRVLWSTVWVLGALFVFIPQQWGASGLSAQAAMGWMMSPHWTTGATLAVVNWLAALSAFAAVLVCVAIAVAHSTIGLAGWRFPAAERGFVIAGAVLALAYWVFGQGFGGVSTGTATDVGSGPVIIVLAAAVLLSGRPANDTASRDRVEVAAGQR